MQLRSDNFQHDKPIPPKLALGKSGDPVAWSDNRSPHLAWTEAPNGTRSFALTCIDVDAPSKADDVNKEGRVVPVALPRAPFVHWLMANIPPQCHVLPEGACSDKVTERGKRQPSGPPGSVQGINSYTDWFASDAQMGGRYLGYDGPCPPWNDALRHRYQFHIYALDVASLPLTPGFSLDELRAAMTGHVLAQALLTGTYSLNSRLPMG